MAYYADLTDYEYFPDEYRPGTVNVGWLDETHPFPTVAPSERFLDTLWTFCQVGVVQTRGIHYCEICKSNQPALSQRNGITLKLGTEEIRVFSPSGIIYAAPNLVYHYVETHHYAPPGGFVSAVFTCPPPPAQTYFDELARYGLTWGAPRGHPRLRIPHVPRWEPHPFLQSLELAERCLAIELAVAEYDRQSVLNVLRSEERARALALSLLQHALPSRDVHLLKAGLIMLEMFGLGPEHRPVLQELAGCLWHGYGKAIIQGLAEH